ncbi:Transcriptional coactivator p15 (PC4) [Macleaya cordata]|uniref:Transcriptional coactivator p15 (PC4) n=1 Tax=Macleaya cordata TaxID=56857 RepID=A0A200QCR5_MACCD|nr:Transcriptional coactivator p15 (PC4) [Macleaya cordata]
MEAKTKSQIEETVMEILKKAEMEDMSEFKIQSLASEKLGLDLSGTECQQIVRRVIESFFLSMEEEPVAAPPQKLRTEENKTKEISSEEEEEAEEEGNERKPSIAAKNYDESCNLIVCKLSNKRKVTVQDYRGKTLVSARKYYLKDAAEQFPSPKEMGPEIKSEIEETVMEILNKADVDDVSEFNVRRLASEKLGMDLSGPECQQFINRVIESFLLSMEEEPIAEPAATEEEKTEESTEEEGEDEYGNAIIYKPSSKRGKKVQDFKGETLVPIKEYWQKDGKQFPSSRGCNIVV